MFEIVEELSLLDKLFGTFKYIIASWVTGAFLSIPIVTLIFRDSPENEENSVSENKESVHDFVNTKTSFLFYDLGEQKIKNDSIYAYDLLIEGGQKRNIKHKSYKNTIKFAVPSAVFNAIFPVKPSVTITLDSPLMMLFPSM